MSTTIDREKAAADDASAMIAMREQFGDLAARHQSQVRAYVSSLGAASSSVDDIAQEAFVVAYKKFDSFDAGTSFAGWVCTIARNILLNDRRKTKRRHELLDERVTDIFLDADPSVELADREERQNRAAALNSCLNELPARSRELVILRYQKRLDPTMIAENCGVPAATIRSRLQRIRDSLRKCLMIRLEASST